MVDFPEGRWTRSRRWLATLIACLLTAYAAVLLVESPLTLSILKGSPESVPLADFGSFYASGLAAAHGLDPFDVYPLTMDAFLGRGTGAAVNLNAPLSVVVFQFLTLFDPAAARLGWFIATLAAQLAIVGLLAAAYRSSRQPLRLVWPFAIAGFWETVNLGQVYALLGLLAVAAWLLLKPRPLLAGILIGFIAAFKPNFLAWPVLLLLAGQRKIGLTALLAAVIFGVLPVVLYGPHIYFQWVAAVQLEPVNPQVGNASLGGPLVRNGASQSLALAISAASLVVLGVVAWRGRHSEQSVSGAAILGSLLVSPLAWVGYTEFLLPVFAVVRGSSAIVTSAALLCIPRLLLQEWADASLAVRITLGSAYTVAWLLLAFELRHVLRNRGSADTT